MLLLCRFSGVTEEDLENTSITLRDVQAVLLNMFSADTILIGHSLESDLFALKVTWALAFTSPCSAFLSWGVLGVSFKFRDCLLPRTSSGVASPQVLCAILGTTV